MVLLFGAGTERREVKPQEVGWVGISKTAVVVKFFFFHFICTDGSVQRQHVVASRSLSARIGTAAVGTVDLPPS